MYPFSKFEITFVLSDAYCLDLASWISFLENYLHLSLVSRDFFAPPLLLHLQLGIISLLLCHPMETILHTLQRHNHSAITLILFQFCPP